jgi:hypothetical protein
VCLLAGCKWTACITRADVQEATNGASASESSKRRSNTRTTGGSNNGSSDNAAPAVSPWWPSQWRWLRRSQPEANASGSGLNQTEPVPQPRAKAPSRRKPVPRATPSGAQQAPRRSWWRFCRGGSPKQHRDAAAAVRGQPFRPLFRTSNYNVYDVNADTGWFERNTLSVEVGISRFFRGVRRFARMILGLPRHCTQQGQPLWQQANRSPSDHLVRRAVVLS